jgi:hypothetical protein
MLVSFHVWQNYTVRRIKFHTKYFPSTARLTTIAWSFLSQALGIMGSLASWQMYRPRYY